MRTIIISKHILLLSLLLCAGSIEAATHRYDIQVANDLSELRVTARFASRQTRIAARSDDAGRFLKNAQNCDSGEAIARRGRRLQIDSGGLQCMRYRIDLAAAASADFRNRNLAADNVIVSPALWLWRPQLGGRDEIIVTLEKPDSIEVALPWTPIDNDPSRYRLAASPQSGRASAVFGRFEHAVVHAAKATFYVSFVRGRRDYQTEPLASWIAATANNIALVYGRFPNPNVHVIVLPRQSFWGGNNAVSFGRVVRDGGESIELMINPDKPLADFYRSWTATHEFSHLMLPYLNRESRWISEGFAQYYQNVLLARAGQYSENYAWQKIVTGLGNGEASAPDLSPNAAARNNGRNTRMKVYWSGAALALMADVELRRRSGGRQSLDSVLGELQTCCLPSSRSWSGLQLFQQLDSALERPLFVPLYQRYANQRGFPDVAPWLKRLGVIERSSGVELIQQAELSAIRDAITRPHELD